MRTLCCIAFVLTRAALLPALPLPTQALSWSSAVTDSVLRRVPANLLDDSFAGGVQGKGLWTSTTSTNEWIVFDLLKPVALTSLDFYRNPGRHCARQP